MDEDSKFRLGNGILSHRSSESLADVNESEVAAHYTTLNPKPHHFLSNGDLDACAFMEMLKHTEVVVS